MLIVKEELDQIISEVSNDLHQSRRQQGVTPDFYKISEAAFNKHCVPEDQRHALRQKLGSILGKGNRRHWLSTHFPLQEPKRKADFTGRVNRQLKVLQSTAPKQLSLRLSGKA